MLRLIYENARGRAVHLAFQHLCCAVRILVYNDSEQKDFTLNAYSFLNIASQAVARVQFINDVAVPGWTEAQRFADTPVGGVSGIAQTLSHGSTAPGYTSPFDLLIPLALNEELGTGTGRWPKLVLNITKEGSAEAEDVEVDLKDVCLLDGNDIETQDPILQWERGFVYTYRVFKTEIVEKLLSCVIAHLFLPVVHSGYFKYYRKITSRLYRNSKGRNLYAENIYELGVYAHTVIYLFRVPLFKFDNKINLLGHFNSTDTEESSCVDDSDTAELQEMTDIVRIN